MRINLYDNNIFVNYLCMLFYKNFEILNHKNTSES